MYITNVTGILRNHFIEHEVNIERFVKNSVQQLQCEIFPKTLNVLYLFRMCREEKV